MQDLRFRQTSQQRAEPLKVLRKTKEEKLRRGEVYNEQNDSRCWDGMRWEVKTEQSVSSYYAFLGICFSTHWWWTAMANGRFWAFLGKDRELPLAENPTFSTLRKIITCIWLIMAHCILYLITLQIPGTMWFKKSWTFLVGGWWWSKTLDIAGQAAILD